MKKAWFVLLGITVGTANAQPQLRQGQWRVSMQLNDSCVLPFNMEVIST